MRLNKAVFINRTYNIRLKYLVCFLLLISCFSCDSRDEEILLEDKVYSMESTRDLWGNILFCVEENDNAFLYYYSRSENKLLAYRLEGDIFKEISSYNMGKEFNNIYIRNPDSIFIFHDRIGNFSLLNRNYQLLDTFTVPLTINSVEYNIYSSSSQNIGIYDNFLILSVVPRLPLDTYFRSFFEIKYSLPNRKIEDHFLTYPSIYDGKNWWGGTGIRYSKCINPQGDILFSFNIVNSLFEYSKGNFRKIEVPGSKYFIPPPPMDPKLEQNPQYNKMYNDTIGYYTTIIYDPYRDLYLRVAAHHQDPTYVDSATHTLKRNTFFDREWSIMFFDREFNLIGEQKFERKKYFFGKVLIIKDGILIAPGDGQSRGENIQFQLFKYKNL